MQKVLSGVLVASVLLITGCGSLAVMKPTAPLVDVEPSKAVVNFVRPKVFYGDGVNHEIWHGTTFVGTLAAGTMIQYATEPGEQAFMLDSKNNGWAYLKINLVEGKFHYVKSNLQFVGGAQMGVARDSDPRIEEWKKELTPVRIDVDRSKEIPESVRKDAEKHFNLLNDGKVPITVSME